MVDSSEYPRYRFTVNPARSRSHKRSPHARIHRCRSPRLPRSSRRPIVYLDQGQDSGARWPSTPAPRTRRPPDATADPIRRRRTGPSTARRCLLGGHQADQKGAGETADQVHTDHVERVIEAELELQADSQRTQHTADRRRSPSAPTTFTDEQDGVMATRPATMPDAAPSVVAWPSRIRSVSSQASMAAAVATVVVMKVTAAPPLSGQRRTGVEAVPAEPQQAGTQHHERQVVRPHRVPGQPLRLPSTRRQSQARSTGVDVDRSTTGEVDRLELVGDPATVVDDLAGGALRRSRTPSARPGSRRLSPTGRRRPASCRTSAGRRPRRRSARP